MATLTHAELGWAVAEWFGWWSLILIACYGVSHQCFPSFRKLDAGNDVKGATKRTEEKLWWAASMMSTIHATYVSYVALSQYFTEGGIEQPANFREDLWGTSSVVIEYGPVFLGYIFLDTALTFKCWNTWPGAGANVIHHACCIGAFWQSITGGYGHFYCMYAWVFEVTTPFINQRWFFDKSGMKGGLLFKINGLLMVFLWIILRICVFGYCMVVGPWQQMLAEAGGRLEMWRCVSMLTIQVAGYALQWMWGYKILKGAMKAVGLIKPTPAKKRAA